MIGSEGGLGGRGSFLRDCDGEEEEEEEGEEGGGARRISFVNSTTARRAMERVTSTLRIAQIEEFDLVAFVTSTRS